MSSGKFRQRRFPEEFRIPLAYPPTAVPVAEEPVHPAEKRGTDLALADLATNLWRVSKKLAAGQNGEIPRAQRMAARHAQAARESLEAAGVRISDHDGVAFHPGLALDVIAYEPRPGTAAETVVETVRPSVFRDGQCIQIGQVIVAQPEEELTHDS